MRMPWTAEARLARSEKGLSSALAGEQTLGDGIGLVTSHMFGGAVVGGGGNVALHANSGDKVNGTANYGSAFVSGAIGGAVAGGAAGVYRARGAKKFSEARVAKAEQKYGEGLERVANSEKLGPLREGYKENKKEARRMGKVVKKQGANATPQDVQYLEDIVKSRKAFGNLMREEIDAMPDLSPATRSNLRTTVFSGPIKNPKV